MPACPLFQFQKVKFASLIPAMKNTFPNLDSPQDSFSSSEFDVGAQ